MPSLSDSDAREIETYCTIARTNGAILSLRELAQVASINATESELAMALTTDSRFTSRFFLESGYIVDVRLQDDELVEEQRRGPNGSIGAERANTLRAWSNLAQARAFAGLLRGQSLLLSVSGGTSYLSAREDDDIDFFCATASGTMWLFMVKAFLLARAFRLARRSCPPLCFSFVMDEVRLKGEFRDPKDALFARDALTANVIFGDDTYHALLEEASWMRGYFPNFYARRLSETRTEPAVVRRSPAWARVLNSFLYCTVGKYISMKAHLLNRRFKSEGKLRAVFTPKIGIDECVYESNRYLELKGIYETLERKR